MAKTKYEASKGAIMRYIDEKTDDIRLRVPKGTKERWKKYAEQQGVSMTRFVVNLVESKIAEDTE